VGVRYDGTRYERTRYKGIYILDILREFMRRKQQGICKERNGKENMRRKI